MKQVLPSYFSSDTQYVALLLFVTLTQEGGQTRGPWPLELC